MFILVTTKVFPLECFAIYGIRYNYDCHIGQTLAVKTYFICWLNAAATISHVLNLNVATIQGWPLIKGNTYCTEAHSAAIIQYRIMLKTSEVNHACWCVYNKQEVS